MRREWLTRIRETRGLTRAEAAQRSGLSVPYYNHIETGRRRPSVKAAQRIALALGFDWTKFFAPNECELNTEREKSDAI